jgi:ABC-2 type transport system ATP-binding protein
MADNFLELKHVTKRYDQHIAVNDVSMKVPRGKIYGLLGPNGAGKTSTIRMITQITYPDSGQIIFDGHQLRPEDVNNIGYMPEERGLYKKMKVKDQIEYLLTLKGLKQKEAKAKRIEWMEKMGLSDWSDRKTTDLSKGMQQKVQFISTVAHEPPLLILDEPFSGLDPVNAQVVEDELMRMKNDGATIIFSTHRMEQVEELCDYIGLINRGKLIMEDHITDVRKRFQHNVYLIDFVGDGSVIKKVKNVEVLEMTDRSAKVKLPDGQNAKSIMHTLLDTPLELLKVELHLPRLHEIFIELVGKDAPVAAQMK